MTTHSSFPAWRIPWTEKPGGLQYTVAKSWTRLKRLNTYTHTSVITYGLHHGTKFQLRHMFGQSDSSSPRTAFQRGLQKQAFRNKTCRTWGLGTRSQKKGCEKDLDRTLKHPERDLSLEFIHMFVEVRTSRGWGMKADSLENRNDP